MPIIGFERLLTGDADQVDVSASCRLDDAAGTILSRRAGTLQPLISDLLEPGTGLFGAADRVWLELDTGRGGVAPSIFLSPTGPDRLLDLVGLAPGLLGLPEATGSVATVTRWCRRRPDVEVCFLGILCGRAGAALRLCVTVPYARAAPSLADLTGSPLADDVVGDALARMSGLVRSTVVTLDLVDGEVGPTIGVELGFGGLTGLVAPAAWSRVLTRLNALSLCPPERIADHLAWLGCTCQGDDPAAWPSSLANVAPVIVPYELVLQRGISHVKLVYAGTAEPTGAKIYFGARVGWRPPGAAIARA